MIQTYTAKAIGVVARLVTFVFETVDEIGCVNTKEADEGLILESIKSYCLGVSHNPWERDGMAETSRHQLHYDIEGWLRDADGELDRYRFDERREVTFVLAEDRRAEIRSYVARFGDTPTGVGRTLSRIGLANIWRSPTGRPHGSGIA